MSSRLIRCLWSTAVMCSELSTAYRKKKKKKTEGKNIIISVEFFAIKTRTLLFLLRAHDMACEILPGKKKVALQLYNNPRRGSGIWWAIGTKCFYTEQFVSYLRSVMLAYMLSDFHRLFAVRCVNSSQPLLPHIFTFSVLLFVISYLFIGFPLKEKNNNNK